MDVRFNRLTIIISCWISFTNFFRLSGGYEIKCSHTHNKQSLSCTFNYLHDNQTLTEGMSDEFRPYTKYISHLTLGVSNLTTFPNDTFDLLPNLQSLTARVDIQTLSRHQFKNASKLMILNLGYNNQISKLEEKLFKFAPALEYLDLGFNQIKEIENRAFRGLANLKILFLEANLITELRNKTFLGLKSLQQLILSKNQINEIEIATFSRMSKLKILQLNQNRIERLQLGIFSNLQAIERIDLSVNVITDIQDGVFDHLTNLNILELGFNRIAVISEGVFDGIPNLNSLFVAYNQIGGLNISFGNLTSLKVLDLSYNPIKQMDTDIFLDLEQLESFELRGCNLTEIDVGIFDNKKALETLDLSENKLSEINFTIFIPLEQLHVLKLEANQISEIANFTEIQSILPNLEFINLSRNEIDCDTVLEMIDFFKNNTIEYEFGEEVDVGCQLLPLRSRAIQAYQLSNAKFNEEGRRLITFS